MEVRHPHISPQAKQILQEKNACLSADRDSLFLGNRGLDKPPFGIRTRNNVFLV